MLLDFKKIRSGCAACGAKFGTCFKKIFNARAIDAFYRALSRSMAANTLVNFLGQLFNFNAQTAGAIVSAPTFLTTVYTSYAGTRWWTSNQEEMTTLVTHSDTRLQRCQKLTDAFFRGISRAEATSNCVVLMGMLTNCDLTIPAGVLSLIALILASWSSYQRSNTRQQYASVALATLFSNAQTGTQIHAEQQSRDCYQTLAV